MRKWVVLAGILLTVTVSCASTGVVSSAPSNRPSDAPATVTTAPAAPLLMPDVCGMLTRHASGGGLRNLDVVAGSAATRYRLFGSGTAPADVGAASQNSVLIRLTGRRVAADSGQPDAVNVTDFTVTYADSCDPAPAPYAVVCGTVSDYVKNTLLAYGSYLMSSPGRAPLKVVITSAHSTPAEQGGGSFGGYVCAAMQPGSPLPVHGGLGAGGQPGGPRHPAFIPQGTTPATLASPSPTGFVVPQACAYVTPPEVAADRTSWKVDCGADANRNARGTLGPALRQQGWTSCGPALATETWLKAGVRLVVVESSLAPGDYPRYSQAMLPTSGCT